MEMTDERAIFILDGLRKYGGELNEEGAAAISWAIRAHAGHASRDLEVVALRKVRKQAEVFAKVSDAHIGCMAGVLAEIERCAGSGEPLSLVKVVGNLPTDYQQPLRETRILQQLCKEADALAALDKEQGRG